MKKELQKWSGGREGILETYITGSRRKLVMSFPIPEMQALAGQAFDEYVAAGGRVNNEIIGVLKDIVEANFILESDVTNQISRTIENVRSMISEKPAVADMPKNTTESETEEERILRTLNSSLRPPRLPAELAGGGSAVSGKSKSAFTETVMRSIVNKG